jgi:hypothetical protein
MKPFFSIALLLLCSPLVSMARTATPLEPVPVFLDSADDFSGYIVAAFTKKQTPADVVTYRSKADYVLHSSAISTHVESTGGKIARCLFASCAGIQDTSTVTVELINVKTSGIEWSYTVHKQRGGGYNQQSMAEAIAKHL